MGKGEGICACGSLKYVVLFASHATGEATSTTYSQVVTLASISSPCITKVSNGVNLLWCVRFLHIHTNDT